MKNLWYKICHPRETITRWRICLGTRLICNANMGIVSKYVIFDDAQDTMEHLALASPVKLHNFANIFVTLAKRADERMKDLIVERDNAIKQRAKNQYA